MDDECYQLVVVVSSCPSKPAVDCDVGVDCDNGEVNGAASDEAEDDAVTTRVKFKKAVAALCNDNFLQAGAMSMHDNDGNDSATLFATVRKGCLGVVLSRLETIGVGSKVGTITCSKCDFVIQGASPSAIQPSQSVARKEWDARSAKIKVEQVKASVKKAAAISFDFVSLLVVASVLAGIGLVNNNTVVIVASMLVSPIM